jgi:hypothetical protein
MTKKELRDKIDWEGGIVEAFNYFGPNIPVRSERVRDQWRIAYDAVKRLETALDMQE